MLFQEYHKHTSKKPKQKQNLEGHGHQLAPRVQSVLGGGDSQLILTKDGNPPKWLSCPRCGK